METLVQAAAEQNMVVQGLVEVFRGLGNERGGLFDDDGDGGGEEPADCGDGDVDW
ncbi:hypothetical protein [Amycolatopsis sp. cmx-4-68]|uniref:hypothetical protein n=1 Tax=Amycolatopsis sp. cmx-4-68 TaxID=2790938 RepID=UPI00397A5DC8